MNNLNGYYILHLHTVTSFFLLTKVDEYDDAIIWAYIRWKMYLQKLYTQSINEMAYFPFRIYNKQLVRDIPSLNIMILTIKERGVKPDRWEWA